MSINSALSLAYDQLSNFAGLENFWNLFDTAFGTQYDYLTAFTLKSQWQSHDFSSFPKIEVVSSDVLGTANGAYVISTNKIYLSDQFIGSASQQSLEAVILEEYGHFVDAQINTVDSAGDEGAIFAALVAGESLDALTLQALKAEDDSAVITVNGEDIAIEQSTLLNPADFTLNASAKFTIGTDGVSSVLRLTDDYWQSSSAFSKNTITLSDNASLTILDFESPLPAGLTPVSFWQGTSVPSTAKLTNQYASSGVLMSGVALINAGIGHAPSGVNGVGGISSGSLVDYDAPLTFQFVSPIDGSTPAYINYFAISPDLWGSSGNNVTITGYDLNGTILGVTTYTETGNLPADTPIELQNVGNIYKVVVDASLANVSNGGIAFDLVRFSAPVIQSSITLAVAPANVLEDGTTNLVYTFTRTGATTNALTVNYTIAGTATNGTDYATIGTSVTFAANSATAIVTVNPTADTTIEANETVALTLATGTGYAIGTTTAVTGTITNDDFPSLSINDISVVEGKDSNAYLTVNLNNPINQTVSFNYTTTALTATANSDYTTSTGTLTIAPNSTLATISIPILNDNTNESNEFFIVTLSNPVNATLNPNASFGEVMISDTWFSALSRTLPEGVENLTLMGTAANGTGNSGNNVLTGNSANNTLNGGGGNDTLNGSTGVDTLIGGLGNDIFSVDSTTDVITENANEGTDTIQSSVTFSLATFLNIENLTLTGSSAINGTGNTANNVLTGNGANNLLSGDTGNDILTGAAGKDTLTGGAGIDKFGYKTLTDSLLANYDLITDFNATTGNDLFLVTTARAGLTTGLTVATLDAAGIGAKLTTPNFAANYAAQFTFTSGTTTRTFVAINDAIAGFNASTDSIVEVTGLTGTLVIGNFVTA